MISKAYKESVALHIAICKHSLKRTEVKLTISTSASITYDNCIQVCDHSTTLAMLNSVQYAHAWYFFFREWHTKQKKKLSENHHIVQLDS